MFACETRSISETKEMVSEEKRQKERELKELTKHACVFRNRVAGEKGGGEKGRESIEIYKLLYKLLAGNASHA